MNTGEDGHSAISARHDRGTLTLDIDTLTRHLTLDSKRDDHSAEQKLNNKMKLAIRPDCPTAPEYRSLNN